MANLIVLITTRPPIFSARRMSRLAEIFGDIGLVLLGSVVFPAVLDKTSAVTVIWGLGLSVSVWIISVWLAGKGD